MSAADRSLFLDQLAGVVEIATPVRAVRACRDPKDDALLEAALGGRAHCLISGDGALLVLHPYLGLPILSPADVAALSEDEPTALRARL